MIIFIVNLTAISLLVSDMRLESKGSRFESSL